MKTIKSADHAKWVPEANVWKLVDDSGWTIAVLEVAPECRVLEPFVAAQRQDGSPVHQYVDKITHTVSVDLEAVAAAVKKTAV